MAQWITRLSLYGQRRPLDHYYYRRRHHEREPCTCRALRQLTGRHCQTSSASLHLTDHPPGCSPEWLGNSSFLSIPAHTYCRRISQQACYCTTSTRLALHHKQTAAAILGVGPIKREIDSLYNMQRQQQQRCMTRQEGYSCSCEY